MRLFMVEQILKTFRVRHDVIVKTRRRDISADKVERCDTGSPVTVILQVVEENIRFFRFIPPQCRMGIVSTVITFKQVRNKWREIVPRHDDVYIFVLNLFKKFLCLYPY